MERGWKFGFGSRLEDVADAAVPRFLAQPFRREGILHRVHQLGPLAFPLRVFLISCLGPGIAGIEHHIERVLPRLQLLAVFRGSDGPSVVLQKDSEIACSVGDNAIGSVLERARILVSRAVHEPLDALVFVERVVVLVLVGDQPLGASLHLGIRGRLGISGRTCRLSGRLQIRAPRSCEREPRTPRRQHRRPEQRDPHQICNLLGHIPVSTRAILPAGYALQAIIITGISMDAWTAAQIVCELSLPVISMVRTESSVAAR